MKVMNRIICFCILVSILFASIGNLFAQSKDIIYAGTSSLRESKGVYVFQYDRTSKMLTEIQTIDGGDSPNFLAISPNKQYLYVVYTNGTIKGDNGSVMAFKIDSSTGYLSKLNEQSTEGVGPAHVSIDPKGRFAYVSNYSTGNLVVYPLNNDGSLGNPSDIVQHSGNSIIPGRQDGPHVHSIIPSKDGNYIYVSDLGMDKIMIYQVQKNGKLEPALVPFVQSTAGAGPRHFVIHPNGNYAYSAEELSSTIGVFSVDKSTGALNSIDRVRMLPESFTARNSAADIHFSPDGKFLYASNRGHESLVIFNVNPEDGKLTLVGHENTGGRHPRNFMIDKRGEYVLVANRDTDNIVVFKRNKKTGKLSPAGKQANVPAVISLLQL